MNYKILTEDQVEQFMNRGWVKIEAAIPREIVLEAQNEIWSILRTQHDVINSCQDTWKSPFYQISKTYNHGSFARCTTTRLIDSIEDIVGSNRLEQDYHSEGISFGWWPINLYLGENEAWDVPVGGWHWDGMHFKHFVNARDQGLLMIVLFSDIQPKGGGTLLAEGSHKIVAKYLADHPDGVEYKDAIPEVNRSHPWLMELTESNGNINEHDRKVIYTTDQIRKGEKSQGSRISKFMNNTLDDSKGIRLKVVETTGQAGDVLLCHPFLYHTGSQNHLRVPRIMCNLNTPLKEKLNLNRTNASDYSLLELSIKHAIK